MHASDVIPFDCSGTCCQRLFNDAGHIRDAGSGEERSTEPAGAAGLSAPRVSLRETLPSLPRRPARKQGTTRPPGPNSPSCPRRRPLRSTPHTGAGWGAPSKTQVGPRPSLAVQLPAPSARLPVSTTAWRALRGPVPCISPTPPPPPARPLPSSRTDPPAVP